MSQINATFTVYYGGECLGKAHFSRIEIYNLMKEKGYKHFIVSASKIDENGKTIQQTDSGFCHAHFDDDEFGWEISCLEENGYNMFDVIHMHE